MIQVFRAEDAPVADRADYWQHVVDGTPVPLEGRLTGGPDFRARLVTGALGMVRVAAVTLPAGRCNRGRCRRGAAADGPRGRGDAARRPV